jgi:exodeoxyribonuclease V alpha subunit
MAGEGPVTVDPFAATQALRAPASLRDFNAAGVLSAADVHVAVRLGLLGGVADADVLLAVALAVRAPRLGHVFVDLTTVADTAAVESDELVDLSILPWPAPGAWAAAVAACGGLVAGGEDDDAPGRPVRLSGSRLYLDRYWREERQVAADLLAFGAAALAPVDVDLLRDGVARLFAGSEDRLQQVAAASAVLRRLAVVAGGPGTGKTTTVARVAALLCEQALAGGGPPPLIGLTAPTGKAAARLQEAVRDEAGRIDVAPDVRGALLSLRASTIHRLLAWRPGSHSRFRHDRANRLPHDVVIVDETSMVPLTLMARLLEAVRPDGRVIFVGDPEQLTAIEAGAVLRDIIGPAAEAPRMSPATQAAVARAVGGSPLEVGDGHGAFGDGIVVLRHVHRFGAGIAAVADAIRRGDGDAVIDALRDAGEDEVVWIADPAESPGPLRTRAVAAGRAVIETARAGDAAAALDALGAFRLLCAHRRGAFGVTAWTAAIERWLADAVPGFDPDARDYAGRPLLITRNDYELRLYNGDTGVVVQTDPEHVSAVFERDRELVRFAPSRLDAVETVFAMTIHKSQGSQFRVAAVLLPESGSRILTRELLYTGVTRARDQLILVGDESAVRAAVARPVARATGLRERLWEGP